MKITRRQLRRVIREAWTQADTSAMNAGGSNQTAAQWAELVGGDVERDEEGQKIVYLSKEDYPTDKDVTGVLQSGWDYEDTYDGTSWVVYTGEYGR